MTVGSATIAEERLLPVAHQCGSYPCGCKPAVLCLDVFHGFHGMRCTHVAVMNVEQQQDCACNSCRRKKPSGPTRLTSSPRPLELNVTDRQENTREDFVLKNLGLVGDCIPGSLRTERPHLCIA